MRTAIVDSLNSPALRESLSGITADATRSALLSSRDLIIELREQQEGAGPLERVIDRVQRLLVIGIGATFLLGALLGSLLVFVLRRRGGGGVGAGAARRFAGRRPSTRAAAPRAGSARSPGARVTTAAGPNRVNALRRA